MTLSAAIDRLSPSQRALVAEFIAALSSPEPIPGLTQQQGRIVGMVKAAGGRVISRGRIADALGTSVDVVHQQVNRIRRHSIGHCLVSGSGGLRWVEPEAKA